MVTEAKVPFREGGVVHWLREHAANGGSVSVLRMRNGGVGPETLLRFLVDGMGE